ncbi:Na(+)-translocating NADH-quinone reductase subunit C [Arenicella xantha]|uniref:Na(+)-translocating NADH-quinone reductase subunit C n=1 Tax=Arenicella xantha TaxID=644221 RepID=A0A395JKU8_9GAMM|nr:Na(+)-translocating NADH-quinone reductase subunit C [Arenicella xantha]RBP48332.1 Na+-transporting NADH:ubiquinone oxidoreductase subunit C [Arenicella xantha]
MRKNTFYRQQGFFSLPNDNIVKTIGVALLLCLICSIIVSGSATLLKPKQVANKLLDKKSNILTVSGLSDPSKTVDELFKQVETRVIDLRTGEYTDAVDADTFDQRKASKDAEYRIDLAKNEDIAGVGGISKYANVYLVRDQGEISKIVLPIKGYGLWSTLYGFLALESDGNTVSSITFYEHGETPGLGGEIENPKWQASWHGKQVSETIGNPVIRLIKGSVDPSAADAEHKIDGLAGATLTSNGVTNLVQFWMGDKAFGPYLKRVHEGTVDSSAAAAVTTTTNGKS